MIDPIIYTLQIGDFSWPIRWYGVIVVIGMFVGAWIVERELKRLGENGDLIWDALVWILIPGIIGARVWFVVNDILGGNRAYIDNPTSIFKVWEGGIHFFGGLLFGAIALLIYIRWNKLDPWVFLDSAGPGLFVGQAIGRIANYINQELYGPPTDLPWGIRIEAQNRLLEFANLNQYPVETTRFHPTFAYEMLWNIAAAGLLLWLARRYEKDLKPGALFSGWLLLAGVGRVWIEFFRPDQPKIEAFGISYSMLVAALMAITGAVLLMIRYKALTPAFAEDWEEEYRLSTQSVETITDAPAVVVEPVQAPAVKKRPTAVKKPVAKKPSPKAEKTEPKAPAKKKPAARTKKPS